MEGKVVADLEGLAKIREFFFEEIGKLPDTLEGLSNLITDVYWEAFTLGRNNPKSVANPATWADSQISIWICNIFDVSRRRIRPRGG
jgi:hypothetical protein